MCKFLTDKRPRRNTGSVSAQNGEYDIDDDLSIKERLKRAESVSNLERERERLLLKLFYSEY